MKVLECKRCHKLFKLTTAPRMYVKLSSSEEINFCPECTADVAELMNKGMDQEERQRAEIIEDLLMRERGII